MKQMIKDIFLIPVVLGYLFYYGWWKSGVRSPSTIRDAYLEVQEEWVFSD